MFACFLLIAGTNGKDLEILLNETSLKGRFYRYMHVLFVTGTNIRGSRNISVSN
jgi:hypothetical protein